MKTPTMDFSGKVTEFARCEDGGYLVYAFTGKHRETKIQFAIMAPTKKDVITLCGKFLTNEFAPDAEKIQRCKISKPPTPAAKEI